MTDLDALLDSATPAFEDVRICLDGARRAEWNELAERAMKPDNADDSDGRMAAPSPAKQAKRELDALADELRDRLLTIRIFAAPGSQWAGWKSKHKPRKDVRYDESQGYNVEAVAQEALRAHAKRLTADGGLESISSEQWSKIFDTVGGGDHQTLIFATVGVNQLLGQQFVGALGKASPATSNSAER